MESFSQTLGNLKNTVVNAFSTTSPTHTVSRSEVLGLEETERSRRLAQVSQSRVDQENAANVSVLIKTQHFPVFKGNVSTGYKRVTNKFEEEERRRRQINKSESSLRRNNANKTARMIQSLGWPFYQGNHYGAEYITMDPTKLLEEEEREWRMHDAYWAPSSKHNAATVANILRWNNFQKNSRKGFKQHTRYLEEKERANRLSANVFTNAMGNAYNESALIKRMGAPFYVQQEWAKRDFSQVHKLEEEERKRRMRNPSERQIATELAGAISGHLNKESELEEKERNRRITDVGQQVLAKQNAKQVSLLFRESSLNKIGTSGPMWLGISRNSMRALEEIERTRRTRDVEGQTLAKQQSKRVADIFMAGHSASAKPSFVSLEEEERQSRILDRSHQQLAVKNSRKVAGLVARHFLTSSSSKTFALAMEESERSRRLQDREQQNLSKNNAKKVSNLVSSLTLAPGHHVQTKEAPLSPAVLAPALPSTMDLPTYGVATTPAPTTVNIPVTPITAAPISTQKSTVSVPVTIQKALPSIPSSSSSTITPTSYPVDSLRSSSEFKRSESPLVAAVPASRSVLTSSPTLQPIVLPTTSAFVPVAPLASAPSLPQPIIRQSSTSSIPRQTSNPVLPRQSSYTSVPVDALATGHPMPLNERERSRLIKQADKHNRKSEKEVKKAEQAMLKAEKMHQKGRDAKAVKLENKAEKLMQLAEHERRWASGLQGEVTPNAQGQSMM